MNALKAELERKRKATEIIRNENDPSAKYIRQKDLISHKYNELEERQRRVDEDRQLKAGGIVLLEAKTKEIVQQTIVDETQILASSNKSTEDIAPDSAQEDITASSVTHDNADATTYEENDINKKETKATVIIVGPTIIYSQIENIAKETLIYKYFKSLLQQWEYDLSQNTKGKQEIQIQKQCKEYVRPLFSLCKRREVPNDILDHLSECAKHCEEGNFVAAHDEYIKVAIGNSPWPMGVTGSSIHERSGRERIASSNQVAHAMNNEQTRKYLTSIKRLMTYAQTKRDDVPPSMKVLN